MNRICPFISFRNQSAPKEIDCSEKCALFIKNKCAILIIAEYLLQQDKETQQQ